MAFREQNNQEPELFEGLFAHLPSNEALIRINEVVDWAAIRAIFARAYVTDPARGGFPGYDPVLLFKLLLLQYLFNLSDGAVVQEAADRFSFRKFLGLSLSDTVPDDTTLVKFRRRIEPGDLLKLAHQEVLRQLAERGLRVKTGSISIVDATLVQSAVKPPKKRQDQGAEEAGAPTPEEAKNQWPPDSAPMSQAIDPDADWTVKNGRPVHGFKLHAAESRESAIITAFLVTAASVHDSQIFSQLLSGGERRVLADKGYCSAKNRQALRDAGIENGIMFKANKGFQLCEIIKNFNAFIGKFRGKIEATFGGLKRWRGLSRARYRGLNRFHQQATLSIIAHNLLTAQKHLA